jgi:hypothetical protein
MNKTSLEALAAAAHAAGQREVPFIISAAGLPNLPPRLADAKSYAERLFDYRPLGRLNNGTAAQALTVPAATAGVTGKRTRSPRLSAPRTATPTSRRNSDQQPGTWRSDQTSSHPPTHVTESDSGSRYSTAGSYDHHGTGPPTERDYLIAMSEDGDGPSQTADIATRMGAPSPTSVRSEPA